MITNSTNIKKQEQTSRGTRVYL